MANIGNTYADIMNQWAVILMNKRRSNYVYATH